MEYNDRDNIIEWIFEKMFDQLTLDSKEFFSIPYNIIENKTFKNDKLYYIVNKLSNRPIDKIIQYFSNIEFKKRFLFMKLKKKINVSILLNDIEYFNYLINANYKYDDKTLILLILNNNLDLLKFILNKFPNLKLTNDLLQYCVEFGYEEMYFFLRNYNLFPNLSIYYKALLGGSINIIVDISKIIASDNRILSLAFQTNFNEAIELIIKERLDDNKMIDRNLISYAIMNNNLQLINMLEQKNLFIWHHELYYAALLSGSMNMINLIESKIKNIHHNHILDSSKCKKGRSSLLLEEIIYKYNGKNYFSHTMNYAIQSKSIEIVKYIYDKGYGITTSNVLTAIKESTCEILEFLINIYSKPLPSYFIYYFGINSFISDKLNKIKILIDNKLLYINDDITLTLKDYKKENLHMDLICQNIYIPENGIFDIDYLMKYHLFFTPIKRFKLNNKLLIKCKICLELLLDYELIKLITKIYDDNDKQLLIDCLFLFGTIDQIKMYYPKLNSKSPPNSLIIMELLCYCQIDKIKYMLEGNLLTSTTINEIKPIIIILNDTLLNSIFNDENGLNDKYIVLSKNKDLILRIFDNLEFNDFVIQNLLLLEDKDIINKLNSYGINIKKYENWIIENDLLEILIYL